jgi:phosphoglycolate phosphatase
MQLVWDMDGTLLDSGVAVPTAYVAAVRQLGGPPVTAQQVIARYWLGTPEVILADLLGRDLEAGDADVYYAQLALAEVAPYPGVASVLADLRARGHRVAIFTGSSSRAAAMLLTAAWGHQYDPVQPSDVTLAAPGAALALLD